MPRGPNVVGDTSAEAFEKPIGTPAVPGEEAIANQFARLGPVVTVTRSPVLGDRSLARTRPYPHAEALALAQVVANIGLGATTSASARRVLAATKRCLDIVLATFILIIAAPVMALIALCVVLESPGPVFYRGVRAGWRGRQLAILKFRKMREGAFGRPLTLGDDERFTRIGGWLAWMKLDELPQLINVIRGEMSLVGPRPEDPVFIQLHPGAFEAILDVRPGITGLSQLAFRAEGRILDPNDPVVDYETRVLPQKIHLDSLYVARSNPLLDIRILCWTLAATLGVPVSVNRSTARMTVRLSRGGRRQTARASRDTPESETTATSEQWADRSTEAA